MATKHGMSNSGTYSSWRAMRNRCYLVTDSSYARYGGRGITVCVRWESFERFLADMGERPDGTTLDRIDPNGNYESSNCRWATRLEQTNNRRPRNFKTTPEELRQNEERRASLAKRGLCRNAASHGPATHGLLCARCRKARRAGERRQHAERRWS